MEDNSGKIYRLNPLLEGLKSSSERINKIYIQRDKKSRKISQIIHSAKTKNIPLFFVPKQKLDRLSSEHQGVVALVAAKAYVPFSSLLAASPNPFLVLLDGLEDPQNLGAILRSAEGAGVDGVILPERGSVRLTEAVAAVSAGAVEHVRVARVKNLARAMDALKKEDLWLVGAEGGRSEFWYEFDYRLPLALVFGSEGKGLRPLIKKKCDKILSIPLLGKISSLNVAAAAAIFFYEVVRQRLKNKR